MLHAPLVYADAASSCSGTGGTYSESGSEYKCIWVGKTMPETPCNIDKPTVDLNMGRCLSIAGDPTFLTNTGDNMIKGLGNVPGATSTLTASCGGSFLGFPTWYRGLEVDPPNDCSIKNLKGEDPSGIVFTVALNIIDIVLRIIGIVAVGFVIWGGFQYIISRGEPERTKSGLTTVRNAIIGMTIAIIASVVVSFVVARLSA
jgi:hypothetical protein